MEYVAVAGIASSNLRLAPNNSDLFVGHNTWSGYYSMLRLLKDSNRGPWDTSFCYLRVIILKVECAPKPYAKH